MMKILVLNPYHTKVITKHCNLFGFAIFFSTANEFDVSSDEMHSDSRPSLIYLNLCIGYEKIVLGNDAQLLAAASLYNIMCHFSRTPGISAVDTVKAPLQNDPNLRQVAALFGYTSSEVSSVQF